MKKTMQVYFAFISHIHLLLRALYVLFPVLVKSISNNFHDIAKTGVAVYLIY